MINLDEVYQFLVNPETMPKSVIDMVLAWDSLVKGGVEVHSLDYNLLVDLAPSIAKKVNRGEKSPILILPDSDVHYVYHPQTGKYLGHFRI